MRVLNALADAGIRHREEPIPRWQFMEMRRVKEASPIPTMADEGCCDEYDTERLSALGSCQRFYIKLGKSGGLFKARKIIALVERAGMEVQIGGFLEARPAFTASAHLALTSNCIRYCDMDTALMVTADAVLGGMQVCLGGRISLPDTTGLGATVDVAYIYPALRITVA